MFLSVWAFWQLSKIPPSSGQVINLSIMSVHSIFCRDLLKLCSKTLKIPSLRSLLEPLTALWPDQIVHTPAQGSRDSVGLCLQLWLTGALKQENLKQEA